MKNIHGKTHGLKSSQLEQLEDLYAVSNSRSEVASHELAKLLSKIADELSRQVAVFLDRNGTVKEVILGGQTQLYLPDIGRARASHSRLRALRLVVAKPRRFTQAKYTLDKDFVTDLEKLRLDAVLQIESLPGGLVGRLALGLLSSKSRFEQQNFDNFSQIQIDFSSLITKLEASLDKKIAKSLPDARERAVLIGVYTSPKKIWQPSINELSELAKTAKVDVLDIVTQQRNKIDPKSIVGSGKLEELCLHALSLDAHMLIFDCDLSPSQLCAITDATDLKILDRTMLILDIFAQRAVSKAGMLQVELAQLKYSLPRLAKKQSGMSRLTGGIGGQGPGETKLEIDKRRVKDRIAKYEREITRLSKQRSLTRNRRQKFPVIALVGYTNAGKSTLLNKLTRSEVYAEDTLFATLDPTARSLHLPNGQDVIAIDTVGFIRDLPKGLINAFRATLEELHEADLLLHVVDGSDADCERHVKVVNEILADLDLKDKPVLLAVNKSDLIKDSIQSLIAKRLGGMMISAETGEGIKELTCSLNTVSTKTL